MTDEEFEILVSEIKSERERETEALIDFLRRKIKQD